MLTETVEKYIKEASLSRIWQHIEAGRPFGMITAFRAEYSLKENLARNKQMEAAIRSAGYGFFRMEGHYVEGFGTDNVVPVKEQSFFVIGDDNHAGFKAFLVSQAKKFGEDSIFYYDPEREKGFLVGTNAQGYPGMNKEVSVGKWHPSKVGEFYSKMKRQTFVFEAIQHPPNILSLVNDKTLREQWWSHLREES